MLSQARINDLQGHLHRMNGNAPMLLDDPDTIWIVQSGSVAVFAVSVEAETVTGARRYLFEVDIGKAMFGIAADSAVSYCLLAVPINETELLQLDQKGFSHLVANANSIAVDLIEGWLQQLNAGFLETNTVSPIRSSEPRLSLDHGQAFQPPLDTVVWLHVQAGQLYGLGLEECRIEGVLPLSDRFWVAAEGPVQLTLQATAAIHDVTVLLKGLSRLQTLVLHYIDLLEQQEAQEELHRLRERERLNQQVTAESLGELVSTLGSQQPTLFLQGTPLLVAAGAVGRAMKVTIRPPARSSDPRRVKQPLEAIARASRLRLRQVLLRGNWWQHDCGPMVGYTQDGDRPVALLPVSASRYELFDPDDHSRIPIDAKTALTLTPIAHMFYRSLPDQVLGAAALLQFASQGRLREILIIIFASIAAALLGMLTPQATAILMDNAIPASDRGLLLQVGVGLFVAALATGLFRLAQGLAILRLETTADISTQAAVWDRLLNLPLSFFRRYTVGDLQSRVLSISAVRRMLGGQTPITLVSGLFGLLNLGLLFYYSWQLAIIAIAIAVLTFGVTTVSGILLIRKVQPLLELQGNIFGQTVQFINGISKLRVAGAEDRAFATWSKHYSRQVKLDLSTQYIEDLVSLFNTVVPTLTFAVLFWFTTQLLQESQLQGGIGLTVGTFLAFNSAFSTFSKGVTDVSNTLTSSLHAVPQWKRAQPILEAVPEVDLTKADPGKLRGNILIDHVSFRYRTEGPLTLDNVTIQAASGEFVALVGGSGSGKSTLFRLLLGFETPEDGAVYYDGQDLAGLDVDAVRRQLGVVLQTGRIMSGSLFDNITSGAQITLEEAWEAARMAGMADDIQAMPMQMHTVISEGGGNLSGGQRQRLLIARALALKPKILLFDEATSALDNRTQAIVSESLDTLQVTRLVIAHRLSTIRNADRIYVLQAGRVVQQGTFEKLAHQAGLFAQLMTRQMAS
jgi:ATP-binding cassette subfamily C protein